MHKVVTNRYSCGLSPLAPLVTGSEPEEGFGLNPCSGTEKRVIFVKGGRMPGPSPRVFSREFKGAAVRRI